MSGKTLSYAATVVRNDSDPYFSVYRPKQRQTYNRTIVNRMSKPDVEEDMRACPFDTTTPALPSLDRACAQFWQSGYIITAARGQCTGFSTGIAMQNGQDCQNCRIKSCQSRQNIGYFSSIFRFASDDEIPPVGYIVLSTDIYRRNENCSCPWCQLIHPFRLASDKITLLVW